MMRPFPLCVVFVLALLLVVAPVLKPLGAEEGGEDEEEGVAEIIERSGMTPALQDTAIELFDHIHLLENSFRNGQWQKATQEVEKIDLFYSKVLKLSEDLKSPVEFSYLQAFEFSLAEITRGIKRQDREQVEKRFLQLQPELFDILDRFTSIPLRLTASRYYITLAITALAAQRFDIAQDEVGEIREYMEQLEPALAARGVDVASLQQQLAHADTVLANKGKASQQALEVIQQSLELSYQAFSRK